MTRVQREWPPFVEASKVCRLSEAEEILLKALGSETLWFVWGLVVLTWDENW